MRHPATKANQQRNRELVKARGRLRSRNHPDQPMSRAELAAAVNAALDALFPKRADIASYYVHERWIGNLERGDQHWASAERRAALLMALGATNEQEIGLFKPRAVPRGVSAEILGEENVSPHDDYVQLDLARSDGIDRRSSSPARGLLKAVEMIGAASLNLDDLDRFDAVVRDARRYADATLVRHLSDCLMRTAIDDGVQGPRYALPAALGIITVVQHAGREARKASVRRSLLSVGARAAEFAGWLYRDCGQSDSADYWRDRASEWAMEATDFAMPGYVLIKKSQSAWDDRDAGRMFDLAKAVQEGPWVLPAKVMAEAVQQQARGLAMLSSSHQQVDDTLRKAREFLDLEAQDQSTLAAHYDAVLFRVQTAICYGESSRPEEASEIYESTLTSDTFSARDFAYFSALKAQSLAASHRPDDAATTGAAALGSAVKAGSARTVRELSRLQHRLEPWRSRPEVNRFMRLMETV